MHIPLAWASLADKMGQGKIPWYTHRLMHRKRVTCELHDSYFRLMTIKHAILRTAEVTHHDGQSWGDIEGAIELLFNSVKIGSQSVWRPDPLVTRCGRESQLLAESWDLWPPVELPWSTRKTQRWWPKEWGSICCSSVRSPTPYHTHTQPFQIKWEVYFFKVFARLYYCVVMILYAYVYLLCVCIVNYGHGYCVTIQLQYNKL